MVKKLSGATALIALDTVAIDLETTGLDVAKARIVQIGAARIDRQMVDMERPMEVLINPEIPIPPESAAIHGVDNAMVKKAPSLKTFWPQLRSFIAERVLIGHTIAFDLTILENEARRHGLEWEAPRALCIRLLAPIVLPELFDPSLDKLASWFNVDIESRHSALSDALTAGRIFVHMLPLLEAKGIRTLAEAERAILQQKGGLQQGMQAGWIAPVIDPTERAMAGGMVNYDTYAYRHTIGEIMARKPVVVAPGETLLAAINTMSGNGISSVLVANRPSAGQKLSAYSIVTERDVMRRLAKSGAAALKDKLASVAVHPLKSIRENAFVYRAIARMQRLKIRHLAVVNDLQELTGMVSARDLLKLRTDAAISLDDAINEATGEADLATAWGTLPAVVNSLITEKLDAHTITRIVSEEIRSMTERAAILAERQMKEAGKGEPPCAYAVMVLGSGGRGESLLKPDQDNAIIFAKGDPGGAEDIWFGELGERFANILNGAGIPLCEGGIMAKSAEWRGSVATWQTRLQNWIENSIPQNLLNVDILFDQIPVHGDRTLAIELFNKSYKLGSQSVGFAKALSSNLDSIASPFGLFGKLRAEGNEIDLKLHGLFPIVTAARALAIRHNFAFHTTRERLQQLTGLSRGDTGLAARLIEHHRFILQLMLNAQEKRISAGKKPSNFVDLGALDKAAMAKLKSALSDVQLIPDLVRDMMF
jgi:DNA polymerase-3 subunit epsilon/CBS domain-containing protein